MKTKRNLKRNLEVLLLVVAVVLVWRGVWGLTDLYLLPDYPALSFSLSVLVGLALLYFHDPKKRSVDELID